MGLVSDTIYCMARPFSFSGRGRVGEYWWFVLGQSLAIGVPSGVLGARAAREAAGRAPATPAYGFPSDGPIGGGAPDGDAVIEAAAGGDVAGALDLAATLLGGISVATMLGLFALLLWVSLASISAAVRRLHDTGRSGWWIVFPNLPGLLVAAMFLHEDMVIVGLMAAIPAGIGATVLSLMLLVFLVVPGEPRKNRFGPVPRGSVGVDGPTGLSEHHAPGASVPAVRRGPTTEELRALRMSRMPQT